MEHPHPESFPKVLVKVLLPQSSLSLYPSWFPYILDLEAQEQVRDQSRTTYWQQQND